MASSLSDLLETKPCRYGFLTYFKSDPIIGQSLREYGEWAQHEIDLLLDFVREGDIVVDVGAFIGTHTLAFARHVGETGLVYAFEPNPFAYQVLEINVRQNVVSNTRLFNVALSNRKDIVYVNDIAPGWENQPGAFSLAGINSNEARKSFAGIVIEVARLDDFDIPDCHLIKVDVEGMEEKVLKGAQETIRRFRPLVYGECLSVENGSRIISIMRDERYEAFMHCVPSYNPQNFRKNNNNFFAEGREANILFVPSERLLECRTRSRRFHELSPLNTLDDLVLTLLRKPQYKYEILAKTHAARAIGHDFWLNEPEANQLKLQAAEKEQTIQQLRSQLAEKESLLASLQQRLSWRRYRIADWLSSYYWYLCHPTSTWRHSGTRFATLGKALRLVNMRRLVRGVMYLLRGDWVSIRDGITRLSERPDTTLEHQIGLGAALELLTTQPSSVPSLDEPVDIIIPIYNGFDYLDRLFQSLLRNTRPPHRLIVIDDASPDPRVWPRLQELLAGHPNAVLLRNEANLGWVRTVNQGATYARGDFVMLNSDVELPPFWLERLMWPIHRDRRVASVTPFANAATTCSFPEMNVDNPLFAGLDVDRIDRWFARIRGDLPLIDVPSGVGFCMGVNGEAWQRIGPFDENAFGRGYGEENDWCLRAAAAGYRNVVAPNLFVYHKHGGSFESVDRDRLRNAGLRAVLTRHPDYLKRVDAFIRSDPLLRFRQIMTLLVACGEACKLPVLVVDHELGGGANVYSRELVEERLASGHPMLLLTARREAGLFQERAGIRCLYDKHAVSFELEDLAVLERLFREHLPLGEIFYNNAVSFRRPLAVVETISRIQALTGARLTIAIHDFYPLCPSYTLLNSKGAYCDLPDVSACRSCLPNNRFAVNPEGNDIMEWRRAWGKLLGVADQILCFSESSRRLVERVYPESASRITVRPHTLGVTFARKPRLNFHAPLHVGVVGAIGYQKGAGIVADLARCLSHMDPSAKITVIGTMDNVPRLSNIRVTGPYDRKDLPDLVEMNGINICFLPSIWPETFSYVTAELMALDVPLVCFDLGAPAERVARYERGRVVKDVSAIAAAHELMSLHRMLTKQT